jgi:hypothetical protein
MDIPNSLKRSTVLVDACFFIDAYSKPEEFADFIHSLKAADVSLVSLVSVKIEFIRSKTRDVVQRKKAYYEQIIEMTLPTRDVDALVPEIVDEYRQSTEGVSVTDFYLAACLKKYRRLLLLTRNHVDFPTKIFARSYIFPIETERDIRTYALYEYRG